MLVKDKIIITYIEDNIEETIELNNFRYKKILEKIFIKEGNNYIINSDIDYICFKNFRFNVSDHTSIIANENALCVLDNCEFFCDSFDCCSYFGGGSFEIIDPKFINGDCSLKSMEPTIDFNIVYNKDNRIKPPVKTLNNLSVELIADDCYDVYCDIKDNNNIDHLVLENKKSKLNGNFDLKYLVINGEEVCIGDDKTYTRIEANLSSVIDPSDRLEVINSEIKTSVGRNLLLSENIFFKNVTLKSAYELQINSHIYTSRENEKEVVVTDKDLCRTNLISILKGCKNLLESEVDLECKNILDGYYFKDEEDDVEAMKDEVTALENLLEQKKDELKEKENILESKRVEKGNAIKKTLIKKPIKERLIRK